MRELAPCAERHVGVALHEYPARVADQIARFHVDHGTHYGVDQRKRVSLVQETGSRATDYGGCRTVRMFGELVTSGSTDELRIRFRMRNGTFKMMPGMPSASDDQTAKAPKGSLNRVHQDMEAIFRPMADRPHPAGGHHAARPIHAREVVSTKQRWQLSTEQVAALLVFGLAQLTFLMGALTSIDRSDKSAPRVATQLPAEASRTALEASVSEVRLPAAQTSRLAATPDVPRGEVPEDAIIALPPADAPAPSSTTAPTRSEPRDPPPVSSAGSDAGEAVLRAFYRALGRGDGEEASAHVVAEKRSSQAFSPQAISRFYGELREPLRLTAIVPLERGRYRVNYQYSAGQLPCDGVAVVSLTSRNGRDLIRSIQALNGC